MGIARNTGILLRKSLHSIYHYNAHISPVNCHIGTKDTVMLYLLVYLGFAANACGIYEHKFALIIFYDRIYGITGSARYIRYYDPLLPCYAVDER